MINSKVKSFAFFSKESLLMFLAMISMTQLSCVKSAKPVLMLDMSKEHDGLRFFPDKGDQVFIRINTDQNNPAKFVLKDENGDWIYKAALSEIVKQSDNHSDSLDFKFFCTAGDGRYLPSNGEETIPNRKIYVSDLYNKKPLFIFNEKYEDLKTVYVTFIVGTSCQKVLGFFKPEEGDQVIVSGSFCAWDEKGIVMDNRDNNDIYKVEIPVKYSSDKPIIEYKFRLLNYRKAIFPQNGWENRENRLLNIQKDKEETSYAEFNDMRRIARFVINTEKAEKNNKFSENKGDILQIKLILDGNESLTDPLMKVIRNKYEIAVAIPLTVQKIRWQIVKNIKVPLTEVEDTEIGLNGNVLESNI